MNKSKLAIMAARAPNVYNLRSFEDAASRARGFRDAGGIILARNLEHVSSEIFTQEYAGLTFLNQGIVVNNEGGYATSIRKLKLAVEGGYRESGTDTQGTGKITLSGESDSIQVFNKEAESAWTEIELKQAELEGINLPSRFLEGHAELYNRELDQIGYLGQFKSDGTLRNAGLLNFGWDSQAATTTAVLADGVTLYNDIAGLINRQRASVLNVDTYSCDSVTMPDTVYRTAQTKFLNTAGTEMSVLAALQMNFPEVTFGMTTKARSVVVGVAAATSITVAFSKNRRAMQFRLPVALQVSNVFQQGFKYQVESYFGIAGLDVVEADSASVLTGL